VDYGRICDPVSSSQGVPLEIAIEIGIGIGIRRGNDPDGDFDFAREWLDRNEVQARWMALMTPMSAPEFRKLDFEEIYRMPEDV